MALLELGQAHGPDLNPGTARIDFGLVFRPDGSTQLTLTTRTQSQMEAEGFQHWVRSTLEKEAHRGKR